MSNILWDIGTDGFIPDAIEDWLVTGAGHLLITGMSEEQVNIVNSLGNPADMPWEVYVSTWGIRALRVVAAQDAQFTSRQAQEHRELLLILQEALIEVARQDRDLASKLSARAYVHLKTDPIGQRRFDGLLHRFTGVLHRQAKAKGHDVVETDRENHQ